MARLPVKLPFPYIEGIPRRAAEQILRNFQELGGQFGSGDGTGYDAIIDGRLSASVPSEHKYVNLTELADNEDVLDVNATRSPLRILVLSDFTEDSLQTITIGRSLIIEGSPESAGVDAANGFESDNNVWWDTQGTIIDAGGVGSGLQVVFRHITLLDSSGTAKTRLVSADAVVLDDVYVEGFNGLTQAYDTITNGKLIARDSTLVGIRFGNAAFLSNVNYAHTRTSNFTLTSSTLLWDGGAIDSMGGGAVTITIDGTTKRQYVDLVWLPAFASSSSTMPTFSLANTGNTYFRIQSELNGPSVTITTAAGNTVVEGDIKVFTCNTPSTAGRIRKFNGRIQSDSTLNGPGQFDVVADSASLTFSGSGIFARVQAHSAASPILNLVGCDDSLILATVKSNASGKPYAIDANSDRTVLVVGGSSTFSTAGTNSSSTSIVIDENLFGAAALAEFIRDTMGTALTAGSNISITPNDGADTITIAVTGITSYPGDEAIQDLVGAMLADSTSIDFTYDDTAGTFTAIVTPEAIQDMLNPATGFIVAGSGMSITYDDTANTLTFASTGGYTDEQAQDAVGTILTDSTTIDFTYNDGANTITATFNPTGDVAMNSHKITGLADGVAATDAATVGQMDDGDASAQANAEAYTDTQLAAIDTDRQTFDYTGSTQTWTKPAGAKTVHVICVGGGGGGGSGRKASAGTTRCGGSGGGGGTYAEAWFKASDLGATETVTVGAGGNGGAAQSTANTDGNTGASGGDSSFGSWVTALGGAGGPGGSTVGGSSVGSAGYYEAGTSGGAGSAAAGISAGEAGHVSNFTTHGSGGGGGASGANTSDATGTSRAGGGPPQWMNNSITGGAGSSVAGTAGGNGATYADWVATGGGGGCGNGAANSSGGAGGNGGTPGGGGGGGGNGTGNGNSAKGGNGGPGRVIVTTYF